MKLSPNLSANLINDSYDKIITPSYDVLGTFPEGFGHILKSSNESTVRLPIPGTKNIEDWLTDAEFKLILTPYGYVHEGFYSDFCLLLPEFINRISEQLVHDYDYIISGHSLAGPIVTLLSTALVSGIYPKGFDTNLKISRDKIFLETYASPYPGNNTFAHFVQCLNINTLMVINTADIVNYVPKGFGFQSIIPKNAIKETLNLGIVQACASSIYSVNSYKMPSNYIVLEFNYAPDMDLIIPNIISRHSIIDSYAKHMENVFVNF